MVTVENAKAGEKMGKNQREKSCKNIREHPRSDEEIRRFFSPKRKQLTVPTRMDFDTPP